ncbi:MAG: sterol desaturase family protein [Algoriphagus aquaeductus]|uniref:sterol desaturase family protein n=1 Tax=Algoriphagus aquaeductus TaxID=475299 RepID=UPI00387A7D27
MDFNLEWLLSSDYTEPRYFLLIFFILLSGIFLRYLVLAWIYHEWVYKKLGDAMPYRRLHEQVRLPQVKKEIRYSFLGALIFAFAGVAILIFWQKGISQLYTQLTWWDAIWLPGSFGVALFLHETYYYWLHRWMHRPQVIRHFHHIHHNSLYTSSFTSFSFHPIEAGLQAIFLPVLVLVLPIHFFVLIALLISMSITAVINHAGVEVYSEAALRSPVFRWVVGATHHDMHHHKFRCNYGLYFTFWDVWMKTEDPGFEKRFEQHTQKKDLIKV